VKCAGLETSEEPDAMSEDELVEVVKTVPVKEASSNDDEGVTEPVKGNPTSSDKDNHQ
jgi:hypothetical protein